VEKDSMTITIPEVEFAIPDSEEVKELLGSVGKKMHHSSSKLVSKIEKLADKIDDFVQDELKEFFEELE
jgi:hypothetical protein